MQSKQNIYNSQDNEINKFLDQFKDQINATN